MICSLDQFICSLEKRTRIRCVLPRCPFRLQCSRKRNFATPRSCQCHVVTDLSPVSKAQATISPELIVMKVNDRKDTVILDAKFSTFDKRFAIQHSVTSLSTKSRYGNAVNLLTNINQPFNDGFKDQ